MGLEDIINRQFKVKKIADSFNRPVIVITREKTAKTTCLIVSYTNKQAVELLEEVRANSNEESFNSLKSVFVDFDVLLQIVNHYFVDNNLPSDNLDFLVDLTTGKKVLVDFIGLDKEVLLLQLTDVATISKDVASLDFLLAAEYSPLGIIDLSTNGTIKYSNPTATKLLGWDNGKISVVEGRNIFQIPFISKNTQIIEGIKELLNGSPMVGLEFTTLFMENPVNLKFYGSPRFDSDDISTGAILMYTDISDLKRTEEELKRQKEELSEFAHQMNHDLLNSINAIIGCCELIKEDSDSLYPDIIIKHSNKMSDLLRRSLLLADAGKVVEKKDIVDLGLLVDEVAELVLSSKVKLIREELPVVNCDREKIVQVFQNIFMNAMIHGQATVIEVSQNLSIGLHGRSKYLIEIINNGHTIPESIINNIFIKGFTTHEKGTGMGLYIVKKIIDAHNWEITVQNEPNTGFIIHIPIEIENHRKFEKNNP